MYGMVLIYLRQTIVHPVIISMLSDLLLYVNEKILLGKICLDYTTFYSDISSSKPQ